MAGDAEAGCYGPLREATAGEHADAARLRHGQQIDGGDDRKEKEGHLKDGRERERKHDQMGNNSGETQRTRLMKSGRMASTLRRSSVALE